MTINIINLNFGYAEESYAANLNFEHLNGFESPYLALEHLATSLFMVYLYNCPQEKKCCLDNKNDSYCKNCGRHLFYNSHNPLSSNIYSKFSFSNWLSTWWLSSGSKMIVGDFLLEGWDPWVSVSKLLTYENESLFSIIEKAEFSLPLFINDDVYPEYKSTLVSLRSDFLKSLNSKEIVTWDNMITNVNDSLALILF